uniref:Uncharacterized protein n=1 Tax=Sinocyclocheilus anshuiensis TaxID=1608454 RepID=A0A671MIV5_9TELE
MKNQQIHQQELKISELEKMAQKNVMLEERIRVLQQQNEDLKDRIDRNLAMSRQLSEENANLQVNVEKESNEKKRLSRTNEELLWRLQSDEPFWKYTSFVSSALMDLALGLALRFSVRTGHHGACSPTFTYGLKLFQRLIKTTYIPVLLGICLLKGKSPTSSPLCKLNTPNRKTQEDLYRQVKDGQQPFK